ncbi:hypothetical protein [Virgibacillus sp. CBA3643]|uniref:hypothetical protein n=1 Tax=Virgibacillus sp. CBA3643 TaxID=2942278 RepID=UPI0035A3C9C8
MDDKTNYIAGRYLSKNNSPNKRVINGYHIRKGRRVAQPFSTFFPKQADIRKKTTDYH